MSLWESLGKAFGSANPVGGALSAASTLGGIISSFGQGARRRKQAQFEHDLAMQAYEKQWADQQQLYQQQLADQRALIQEERAYNDFDSIMKRANKAGVNVLAALGQAGGAGMQSSAGAAPSAATPSASSGRIPSPDNVGANLINAGATLSAQVRQNALLDANVREAEARASIEESEANWRDKQLAQDYENSVTYKDFLDAGILDKTASARFTTAKIETEQITQDILKVDRNVAQATESMQIEKYRTSLNLALNELKRSEIDTEFKRDIVVAELSNLNAQTDSIIQHVSIDWKNSAIAELNAHTALKQYGLSREEFVSLDKYRQDMVRLEEQDQVLREKIERRRNTKDYIIAAAGWINDRSKIAAEKERRTNEYRKNASSTALQLLGLVAKTIAK